MTSALVVAAVLSAAPPVVQLNALLPQSNPRPELPHGTVSLQGREQCDGMAVLASNFSVGDLGFSLYTENPNHLHLTCMAVGEAAAGSNESLAVVQRTVTEFQRGQVGIASRQPAQDAAYPCSDQDSWGQLNLEVTEINGISVFDAGAQSITASEPTCQMSSDTTFFDGSITINQTVNEYLAIEAFMFKNDEIAQQTLASIPHTMTLGNMGACRIELLFMFRPMSGGGLSARVQVRLHAFGNLEEQVNNAVTAVTDTTNNALVLSLPTDLMLDGSGQGPSGCGSTTPLNASSPNSTLMEIAMSFVCASTGESVSGTMEWDGQAVMVNLTPEQAPESCGTLYWDPLVTPIIVPSTPVALGSGGGGLVIGGVQVPMWALIIGAIVGTCVLVGACLAVKKALAPKQADAYVKAP